MCNSALSLRVQLWRVRDFLTALNAYVSKRLCSVTDRRFTTWNLGVADQFRLDYWRINMYQPIGVSAL